LPNDTQYNIEKLPEKGAEGDRSDGRHLINEWKETYPQGTFVNDQADFDAIDEATTNPVFALFNESHMNYEADRNNDLAGEPSLSQMTKKSIKILDNYEKGFFLTVESGRIDHGHHAGNAFNALEDTLELAKAIDVAMANTNADETLILVTADHSHVFTIAGYPKRGNPILGKLVKTGEDDPALAKDNMPYTTLGYANGLGYHDFSEETDADEVYGSEVEHITGRVDLTSVNTQAAGFHQEALVPLNSETHAGEDVSIHATGPGAHLVQGEMEQSVVFHVIQQALGLTVK